MDKHWKFDKDTTLPSDEPTGDVLWSRSRPSDYLQFQAAVEEVRKLRTSIDAVATLIAAGTVVFTVTIVLATAVLVWFG